MGVIHRLHGQERIPPTTVWISEEEKRFADNAVKDLPPGRWLYLAPAVTLASKLWPIENYIRLAHNVRDIFSAVILDGSPSEASVTLSVARELKLPYVDLAGRTNLLQAAAVLRHASLFVGSDSGLGHVASAVATPTLTFFSNDKPERVLPWGNRSVWLRAADGNVSSISAEEAEKKIRGLFLD
jgi:ADP-heptose:LPS heptosyltransferase